jgi:aerobic-type carbon monoxide dehydrogenase small subunit (CoxS/CutS family)
MTAASEVVGQQRPSLRMPVYADGAEPGKLCRCAAYPEIVQAVRLAARSTGGEGPIATDCAQTSHRR